MGFNLRNRHFLKELDFTKQELVFLLKLSKDLKAAKYAGTEQQRLVGKNIALIFEKTSTRTRCAFEVAAHDQGAAHPLFQRTNSLRHRRGRDEQRLRRALEATLPDDGGQGGERRIIEHGLVQLHRD